MTTHLKSSNPSRGASRTIVVSASIIAAIGVTFFAGNCSGNAQTAVQGSINGYWLTAEKDSIIQLSNCGATNICGTIRSYKGTGKETDEGNPDKTKRNRPICNLQIIGGLTPKGKEWKSGWIYDPEVAEKYSLSAKLVGPNKLKLRGYIGTEAYGEDSYWTRSSKIPKHCQDV